MRLRLLTLALLGSALACAPRQLRLAGAITDDDAAVRHVEAQIIDAENRGDPDIFERLLAPDVRGTRHIEPPKTHDRAREARRTVARRRTAVHADRRPMIGR